MQILPDEVLDEIFLYNMIAPDTGLLYKANSGDGRYVNKRFTMRSLKPSYSTFNLYNSDYEYELNSLYCKFITRIIFHTDVCQLGFDFENFNNLRLLNCRTVELGWSAYSLGYGLQPIWTLITIVAPNINCIIITSILTDQLVLLFNEYKDTNNKCILEFRLYDIRMPDLKGRKTFDVFQDQFLEELEPLEGITFERINEYRKIVFNPFPINLPRVKQIDKFELKILDEHSTIDMCQLSEYNVQEMVIEYEDFLNLRLIFPDTIKHLTFNVLVQVKQEDMHHLILSLQNLKLHSLTIRLDLNRFLSIATFKLFSKYVEINKTCKFDLWIDSNNCRINSKYYKMGPQGYILFDNLIFTVPRENWMDESAIKSMYIQ